MPTQNAKIYEFEDFRLDFSEKTLNGMVGVISLTPKVFETLCLLVENAGHLVEKDELMQQLWQDRFVEESNLTFNIKMLRKALGDDAQKPRFIETVQSRGYRFIAKVNKVNGASSKPFTFAEKPATHDSGPDQSQDERSAPPSGAQKQPTRVILFTVGFATAIFLVFMLSFNFGPASSVSPNDVRSIAVLPTKSLTAENRDPLYEFGIADSLVLKLSLAKNLVVRPLSATRKYADMEQDAIAAGREQKVDFVLASNYQISDGKIRITSQLFNVANGQVEDIFKVEREDSGIFALQDTVAATIGQSLLKRLNREPSGLAAKHYTTNEEAYRLYLLGSALADKRTQVSKAVEYFEQAIKLDPNYAPAYARLANALTAAVGNRSSSMDEQYPKAKAVIEKALSIDPNLAEAHSFLGEIMVDFEGDFAGAENEHHRAIALDPNSSVAHRTYALTLTYLGRHDEAIAESKTAIDLEPSSVINQLVFGRSLLFARRYNEAITVLERAAEMDPEYFFVHQSLSVVYHLAGDDGRAFESLMKAWALSGNEPSEEKSWRITYARSGWQGILERQLEQAIQAEKKGQPNYNKLANLSSELERRDEAFAYLEKAIVQYGTLTLLKVHPRFDHLRSDPRFDELLKRVGLN